MMKSTINDILRALQVFLTMIRDTPSILAQMIGIHSSRTSSAAAVPAPCQRCTSGCQTRQRASAPIPLRPLVRTCAAASPQAAVPGKSTCPTFDNLSEVMEVDEGDGCNQGVRAELFPPCNDAMDICSEDSSSDFLVPLAKDLDSISFRLALKKARAKHGQFGTY